MCPISVRWGIHDILQGERPNTSGAKDPERSSRCILPLGVVLVPNSEDATAVKQELLELADICDKLADHIEDCMTAGW
jgi:hypothetical protein